MGRGGRGSSADFTEVRYQPAGIYGWRKRCLYIWILFILIVVVMNLALTIWILRVFNFSIEGFQLGKMRMTEKGLVLDGDAEIVKTLYTSKIYSKGNKDLQIVSSRDVRLQGIPDSDMKQTSLHIATMDDMLRPVSGIGNKAHHAVVFVIFAADMCEGKNGIIATCDSFEVQDKEGKRKLLVSDNEVQYHTDEVVYTGKAVFDGSVETPLLRGPITDSLRLESASSSIMLSGPEGISVQAPAGNILIKSSNDISIQADNKIFFNSTNLFLKNVPVSSRRKNGHTYAGVYQLCMCENGRLFLGSANGECVPTKTICD